MLMSCVCLLCFLGSLSAQETQFIFISGGSASGKTTLANSLANCYGEEKVLIISVDNYLDKRLQPQEDYLMGVPNFDNPSMVNWELLLSNLKRLQNGQEIDHPLYSFSSWIPEGTEVHSWRPIVIVEGIHAFHDSLDGIQGLRIFIHASERVRYERRFKRDLAERGYSEEFINKTFFEMALPFEKIFLEPKIYKADFIVEDTDQMRLDICI